MGAILFDQIFNVDCLWLLEHISAIGSMHRRFVFWEINWCKSQTRLFEETLDGYYLSIDPFPWFHYLKKNVYVASSAQHTCCAGFLTLPTNVWRSVKRWKKWRYGKPENQDSSGSCQYVSLAWKTLVVLSESSWCGFFFSFFSYLEKGIALESRKALCKKFSYFLLESIQFVQHDCSLSTRKALC